MGYAAAELDPFANEMFRKTIDMEGMALGPCRYYYVVSV